MDMRATMGITFGAGVLVGFVIGQLIAAIKEKKEEESIFNQPNSDGKTWDECVEEARKTKSEKIPEGKIETEPFKKHISPDTSYSPSAEFSKVADEYAQSFMQGVEDAEEELEGQLNITDQDTSDHIGLQHAYEINADDWNEDMGPNWSYRTYFWNKTRLMWYTVEGDEADYTDIHLELGDALCKRICNHTRLYTELIFRRDDLMMDIRVFVTDDEGMPEAIQRYS